MDIIPNVIIIFSIIGIGFGAGLHLNLIDDSVMIDDLELSGFLK